MTGAVLAIARAELRARWRPLLALALLIGLGVGGTTSLVAGARRSSSVIDRFREAQSAADLVVQPFEVDPERLAELRAEPSIEAAAPLAVVFAKVQGSDTDIVNESQVRVAVDGRYGVDVDRGRILAGTPLNHDDPHAVEISESVAAEHGLAPGDRMVLETLTVPQIVTSIFEGLPAGAPDGPVLELVVQSVVRPPTEALGLSDPGAILLTRALWEQVGEPVPFDDSGDVDPTRLGGFDNVVPVRVADGRTAEAIEAARRIWADDDELFVEESAQEAAGIADLSGVVTNALLIAAAVAGIATAVVGAQGIARHTSAAAEDRTELTAIGMRRRDRAVATALPLAVVLVLTGVVATAVAIVASRWFPAGELRRLEPDRGMHADLPVLAIGVVGAAVFIAAFTLLSARRAQGRRLLPEHSRLARLLSRGPVVPSTALRLATGRGVPVRPAFGGAVAALAGIAAAATFGTSLDRFVDDPVRDGWTWDAEVGMGDGLTNAQALELVEQLAAEEVVDGALLARTGTLGTGEQSDDVQFFGLEPVEGDVSLLVLDGRLAQTDDEVAVGSDTAERHGANLGDLVEVEGVDGVRSLRVTGIVRFPIVGSDNAADGMALTLSGLDIIAPESTDDGAFGFPTAFVDWAPGVSDAAGRAALGDDYAIVTKRVPSSDVNSLSKVGGMVPLVAGGLALLGILAIAHALTVAVRRQRQPVGVLRAIGFVRAQIRASVIVQSLAYGALGLALGAPLGVAAGRWVWTFLARDLGAADDPITPVLLLLAVPATLLVVGLIAVLPARAAARTNPAVALRSE